MKKQIIKDSEAISRLNRHELKSHLSTKLHQILDKKNYLNVKPKVALGEDSQEKSTSILRQTQEDLKLLQQQALNPMQKESLKMLAQM